MWNETTDKRQGVALVDDLSEETSSGEGGNPRLFIQMENGIGKTEASCMIPRAASNKIRQVFQRMMASN
jgi:CRISPR/Cas system-associated endonuclease/helicase Cas3